MTTFIRLIFLCVLLCATILFSSYASAQTMQSEDGVLKQTISGTDVTIEYSRPSVRGRAPLFGGLEKWGHTWTPGANMATTIKFSEDVKLNDAVVEAGKYSVWFHLVEAGPWKLMLHPDTTKGHLPAPDMSEAYMTVDIHPEEKQDFTETSTWNVEHVRADGGVLEFMWGNTRVPIELEVDPGFEYSFERADVEKYLGVWLVDKSMSRPPDSTIAIWRAEDPENTESLDNYLASLEKKEEQTFTFIPESGMILVEAPVDEETLAYFKENGIDPNFYQSVLVRRGNGIFSQASLMNGELSGAGSWSFMEFEFNDSGKAIVWVERDATTDEIMSRATRVN